MTLTEFLTARLDADEAAARAASPGPWTVDSEVYAETIYGVGGVTVVSGGRWGGEASVFNTDKDAAHIARHDPARVLREVAAKRAVVAQCVAMLNVTGWEYDDAPTFAQDVLRHLAAVYSDHADYREEWKP